MDMIAAAQWLSEAEGEDMAKKFRIPNGMKPDRNEQRRRGIIGTLRRMNEVAPPPTLPPIKAPTLAEIEAKYGK